MTDRTELLEAALDSIPEGIVLLGDEAEVVFWNGPPRPLPGTLDWSWWGGQCLRR